MEFASPYVYAEDTAETGSGVAADAGAALTPPLTDATEGVSVTDLQQDFVSFASPALCDGGDGAAASAPPAPPRRGGGRGFAGGAGDNVGAGRGGGGRGWNVFERTAGYVFKGRDQNRRLDCNVLRLKLSSLGQDVPPATGDPVLCNSCGAALSSFTDVGPPQPTGERAFTCLFCGSPNTTDAPDEEIPAEPTVEYLLEPPPAAGAQDGDTYCIFVIDTSGSMGLTSEVQGNVQLRGDHSGALSSLRAAGDASDQRLPGERINVTYVSRLQAVQAAVDSHVLSLVHDAPTTRVGVVTFAGAVTVHGDGSQEAREFAGDRLTDAARLRALAGDLAVEKPVSEAKDTLKERLFSLEEGGQTALGPAVVVALAIASRKAGSKVVLCTDGASNVGVGCLEGLATDQERTAASSFYDALGQEAARSGVTVDVIGIEGQCDLESLGALAERTGGDVSKVDPLQVHNNFAGMLARPLLAMRVTATLFLHPALRFRGLDAEDLVREYAGVDDEGAADAAGAAGAAGAKNDEGKEGAHGSKLEQAVGNVTEDTELTFEFAVKPVSERRELKVADLREVPFQVQIEFSRVNGAKCLRVLSAKRPVTQDRAAAERELNVELMGSHVTQQAATLASAGAYETAMLNSRHWSNLLRRNVSGSAEKQGQFEAWAEDYGNLDRRIQQAVIKEAEGEEEEEEEDGDDLFSASSVHEYADLASVTHHQQEEQEDALSALDAAAAPAPMVGGGTRQMRFMSKTRKYPGSVPASFAMLSARRKANRSKEDSVAAEIRNHKGRNMGSRARKTPK